MAETGSSATTAASSLFNLQWTRWIEKRLPKSLSATLQQRQIFIVPNKLAAAMLALIILLFMLAANFQNSLIYMVCFWLMALLVLNILHTYYNLAGLRVTAIRAEPCFAGDHITLELELSRSAKQHKYALNIGWPQQDNLRVDLIDHQNVRVKLTHPAQQRGYFQIPRLEISSTYPTGLAIAWSYFTPDLQAIIYPAPRANPLQPPAINTGADNEHGIETPGGSNDFGGIRDYQRGDTPRHIHWGKYAQTGELYTKTFVDHQTDDCWLDWDNLTFPGIEARLSHLCSKVLELHEQRRTYGLRLPGKSIDPGHGEAHKTRCLHALALHGMAA